MKKLNEDYKSLSELVRTAYKLISPMTYHDDVDRLTPEFVMNDAKKRPGCYLKLGQGADHTLFPICNRYGYKDPKMIKFSLKLAKKVADRNMGHDTSTVIIKLQKLLSKYDKPVPNTVSQAALKGQATKTFNKKMKISEAGQIKAEEKIEEWGNSDLNADDRAKKFVQDMYNIKEDVKEEVLEGLASAFLKGGVKAAGRARRFSKAKNFKQTSLFAQHDAGVAAAKAAKAKKIADKQAAILKQIKDAARAKRVARAKKVGKVISKNKKTIAVGGAGVAVGAEM